MGVKQIEMPESLLLLPRSSLSGIKTLDCLKKKNPLDCYKPFCLQSSDIVDSDNFCHFSSCFYGGENIWRSFYSTICLCTVYFFFL